jgi:hypothetical protein
MNAAMPPRWAEALLESLLAPAVRQNVTGDLLEEYRTSIVPHRGGAAAKAWYVRQVAGFAWRHHAVWAGLFLLLFFGRSAYDALIPTAIFGTRAVMTWLLLALSASVGIAAVWRSRMFRSGLIAGATTSILAALLSSTAVLTLYAWSGMSPGSLLAGRLKAAGGVDEILVLPIVLAPLTTALAGLAGVASGLTQLLVGRR